MKAAVRNCTIWLSKFHCPSKKNSLINGNGFYNKYVKRDDNFY